MDLFEKICLVNFQIRAYYMGIFCVKKKVIYNRNSTYKLFFYLSVSFMQLQHNRNLSIRDSGNSNTRFETMPLIAQWILKRLRSVQIDTFRALHPSKHMACLKRGNKHSKMPPI